MSLKINYLDKLNNSVKNIGIFVSKETKIADFKGILSQNTAQKVIGYIIRNKKSEKNKIYCLNEDHDKKILIIFVSQIKSLNDSENLGANFYDYINKDQIKDISIVESNPSNFKNKVKL